MHEQLRGLGLVVGRLFLRGRLALLVGLHNILLSLQLYGLCYRDVVDHILTLIDVPQYAAVRARRAEGRVP